MVRVKMYKVLFHSAIITLNVLKKNPAIYDTSHTIVPLTLYRTNCLNIHTFNINTLTVFLVEQYSYMFMCHILTLALDI